MAEVFINYRYAISAPALEVVFESLSARFGVDEVFAAAYSVKPGQRYDVEIGRSLDSAKIFLAVVGQGWHELTDSNGARLLAKRGDWVRTEILSALARGMRILPVLTHGARFPRSTELPPALRTVARLQYVEIDERRPREAKDALIRGVDAALADSAFVGHPNGGGSDVRRRVAVIVGAGRTHRDRMFDILASKNLEPYEWIPPGVGEHPHHSSRVKSPSEPPPQAVVALLAPERVRSTRRSTLGQSTVVNVLQTSPQALVRLGQALSAYPGRVIAATYGDGWAESMPSGVKTVHMGAENAGVADLVDRLREAGCTV